MFAEGWVWDADPILWNEWWFVFLGASFVACVGDKVYLNDLEENILSVQSNPEPSPSTLTTYMPLSWWVMGGAISSVYDRF